MRPKINGHSRPPSPHLCRISRTKTTNAAVLAWRSNKASGPADGVERFREFDAGHVSGAAAEPDCCCCCCRRRRCCCRCLLETHAANALPAAASPSLPARSQTSARTSRRCGNCIVPKPIARCRASQRADPIIFAVRRLLPGTTAATTLSSRCSRIRRCRATSRSRRTAGSGDGGSG